MQFVAELQDVECRNRVESVVTERWNNIQLNHLTIVIDRARFQFAILQARGNRLLKPVIDEIIESARTIGDTNLRLLLPGNLD